MQKVVTNLALIWLGAACVVSCRSASPSVAPEKKVTASTSKDSSADANEQEAAPLPGIRASQCAAGMENAEVKTECSIPLKNSNLILYKVAEWAPPTNAFKDKDAHWIGLATNYASTNGYSTCRAFLTQQVNSLHVSNIKLAAPEKITVEMLAGAYGSVTMWQDGAADKMVFHMEDGGTFGRRKVKTAALPAGEFVVAVQTVAGQGLNSAEPVKTDMGIAVSIQDSQGAVLLHTIGDSRWCGFYPAQTDNLADYIRNVAGCLPCYGGTP